MTAVTALVQAVAAGIRVTRDGDNLVLTAFNPPPAWVVEPLLRHKDDLLTLLSLSAGCSAEARPSFFGSSCSMEARDQQQSQSNIVARPRVDDPPQTELGQQPPTEKSNHAARPPQHALTVYQTAGDKSGKAGEGGVFSTVETDPSPGLPWPQPGDTLLPGWGDRVSMEYRLRVASEEECYEWAEEFWQLDLVAKARGYPKKWAVQTSQNRLIWREAFAARDECRASDFEQFREAERV
jgi:hypothetical protein